MQQKCQNRASIAALQKQTLPILQFELEVLQKNRFSALFGYFSSNRYKLHFAS